MNCVDTCSFCYASLPRSILVRSAQGELARCENCGRPVEREWALAKISPADDAGEQTAGRAEPPAEEPARAPRQATGQYARPPEAVPYVSLSLDCVWYPARGVADVVRLGPTETNLIEFYRLTPHVYFTLRQACEDSLTDPGEVAAALASLEMLGGWMRSHYDPAEIRDAGKLPPYLPQYQGLQF